MQPQTTEKEIKDYYEAYTDYEDVQEMLNALDKFAPRYIRQTVSTSTLFPATASKNQSKRNQVAFKFEPPQGEKPGHWEFLSEFDQKLLSQPEDYIAITINAGKCKSRDGK